jgi:hypothetical protein
MVWASLATPTTVRQETEIMTMTMACRAATAHPIQVQTAAVTTVMTDLMMTGVSWTMAGLLMAGRMMRMSTFLHLRCRLQRHLLWLMMEMMRCSSLRLKQMMEIDVASAKCLNGSVLGSPRRRTRVASWVGKSSAPDTVMGKSAIVLAHLMSLTIAWTMQSRRI